MENEKEIWKQIPMYPTYAASNRGRIKNIKKDKIMAQSDCDYTRDYKKVCLSYLNRAYTKKVARLIWAAFNGCECSQTINHIDGNPKNNHINNLECISNQENCAKKHIYNNRINKYGLTDEIRKQIVNEYNSGKNIYHLSKKYHLPSNYLYTTFSRGSWKHLCTNIDIDNTNNSQNK